MAHPRSFPSLLRGDPRSLSGTPLHNTPEESDLIDVFNRHIKFRNFSNFHRLINNIYAVYNFKIFGNRRKLNTIQSVEFEAFLTCKILMFRTLILVPAVRILVHIRTVVMPLITFAWETGFEKTWRNPLRRSQCWKLSWIHEWKNVCSPFLITKSRLRSWISESDKWYYSCASVKLCVRKLVTEINDYHG